MADVTLSQADTDFLTAMIAHHTAAIAMANTYLATPTDQRLVAVTDLACSVIMAQTAEITQMQDWLGDSGA